MEKAHLVKFRYRIERIPSALLDNLERMEDRIRIGKTAYTRFTFLGVPGRVADVIIADALLRPDDFRQAQTVLELAEHRPHELPPALQDVVLEACPHAGKYDGRMRQRYAFRQFPLDLAAELTAANVMFSRQPKHVTVTVVPHAFDPIYRASFDSLRSELDDYNLERIVIWHWTRYYRHLNFKDAEDAAKVWALEVQHNKAHWTLAEANRAASRMLYRLSVDLGWRKLTIECKRRLYLPDDSPQWHRADDIIRRNAALAGNPDPFADYEEEPA